MNQVSAFIHGDTLVYQEEGGTVQVVVGTPQWYRWLTTASTFAFSSEEGSFTAYQEQAGNKHGDRYWKAYRKRGDKLASVYVGKSERLTLDRLKAAAAKLTDEGDTTLLGGSTKTSREHEAPSHTLQLPQSRLPREDAPRGELLLVRDQLLTTKFYIPVTSHLVIPRPRLTDLLTAAMQPEHAKLILVSAPAGFGKTTLLAAWLKSLPKDRARVAWVSLDEEDNDPLRFWKYVFTALDLCQPGLCTPLLTFLQSQQASPLNYVLTAFMNSLTEHPEPLLLVLDDYHLITEQAIHTSFTYLLEHRPSHLSLILSTRYDPPLPLARLRGRGHVLEIRTEQLRCTSEEAADFLGKVMGLSLPPDVLEEVTSRSEGWLVGLQLLGLWLQNHPDRVEVLEEMSWSQHSPLGFLIEGMLQQQSTQVQTFLLHTSVLEQLSAPLCDAVMKQVDSQQVLEYLERADLFVIPLDEQRRWYRYHPLIVETLRHRLEQVNRDLVLILHLRACQWYEQQGCLTEAMHHALQAKAWEHAADLIERAGELLPWSSEVPTIWRWLQQLPEEVLRSRPRLCIFHAEMLHLSGQARAAEPWLEAAEVALKAASPAQTSEAARPTGFPFPQGHERERLLGHALGLRAMAMSYDGESGAILELCQQALAHLSEQDSYERAIVAYAQSLASLSGGQAAAATQKMREASSLMHTAGNIGGAAAFLGRVASFLHLQGHLREAWRTLQQAIQMVGTASGCLRLVIVGLAYIYVYQADLLREWNQLDKALSLALHGNQLGEQFGNALYVEQRHAVLMRIYLSRGEVDQANRVLQQFIQAQHAQHVGNPNQVAWVTSGEHVRVFLARGERGQAIRWVKELEQGERPSSLFARERQDVARARILLAQQKPGEALSLLEPWLATQAAERRDHDIEMRLLQVLAYQMRQEESLALDTLAQAVRLAEPEEYIRRFVDEGPPIAALIATLKAQDRGPTPYLDTLLAAFQPDETTSE